MNTKPDAVLRAIHLSKRYCRAPGVSVSAVVDVNLEVKQGEVILLSGPNGSGKTTLLSLLGCMIRPSDGKISILGQELTTLGQSEIAAVRRERIGFIFQTFQLLDSLSVLENVELILNLSGKRRPASRERAEIILDELKILHRASFFPSSLSGGEKQRVAIARAMANDPALILADEPTGSLDSNAGQLAIKLLCETAQRRDKTVIIASHDSRIQHFAHRKLLMEDGRIIEET